MHLRLGGCLYALIGLVLKRFPVDGFSATFSIHFFCLGKIFELSDENHEYWECYLCQFYDYISKSNCGVYGRPF